MLTNYSRSIKYLTIFLLAISTSILVIRPLVASPDKFIFLSIILTISLLVLWKPKKIFTISIGGAILFYHPFLQGTLFFLGNAKVYAQDLLMTALTIYLVAQVLRKYRRDLFKLKSTWFFVGFFLWGLLSIGRGYPKYGFSAIGESRWYVLILLYYFFILFSFDHKDDVPWFLKWISLFISMMIIGRFVFFFFFNDNVLRAGYLALRFINAAETLLVAYLFIFLFLFLLNRKNISDILFYTVSFVLLSIIIAIQHRSVWLSTAGGLFTIYIVTKKKISKVLMSIGLTICLLFTFTPFVNQVVGINLYETLKKSAIFLQSPEDDPNALWRLTAWRQELKKTKKNPIIGEGLGGYSEWFDGHQWQRVMVHNGYIMTFSKFGIIGVLLLFAGFFFWSKEMNQYLKKENEPHYKIIGMALLVSFFMHLIYTVFYDFTMFFWIILGMGSNMIMNHRNGFHHKIGS
jgi:O-antigen ligase